MQTKLLKYILDQEHERLLKSPFDLGSRIEQIEYIRKLLKSGYNSPEIYSSRGYDEYIEEFVPIMKFDICHMNQIIKIFHINRERFYDYKDQYIRIQKLERIIEDE